MPANCAGLARVSGTNPERTRAAFVPTLMCCRGGARRRRVRRRLGPNRLLSCASSPGSGEVSRPPLRRVAARCGASVNRGTNCSAVIPVPVSTTESERARPPEALNHAQSICDPAAPPSLGAVVTAPNRPRGTDHRPGGRAVAGFRVSRARPARPYARRSRRPRAPRRTPSSLPRDGIRRGGRRRSGSSSPRSLDSSQPRPL